MNTNYFCDSMYSELTAIRSQMHGIVSEISRMPGKDKEKVGHWFADISMMVDDLDRKIDTLKRECPLDWRKQREQTERWDEEHIPDMCIGT